MQNIGADGRIYTATGPLRVVVRPARFRGEISADEIISSCLQVIRLPFYTFTDFWLCFKWRMSAILDKNAPLSSVKMVRVGQSPKSKTLQKFHSPKSGQAYLSGNL